jgi:hypothetical protein
MNAYCPVASPPNPIVTNVLVSCARPLRTLAIAVLAWLLPLTLVQVQHIHAQAVSLEDALGVTVLVSGDTVAFGGASEEYHEPAFQFQEADFTHTVLFTGITTSPYSFLVLQRSFDEMNWEQVFAPGLEPDPAGVIVFHDPNPSEQMFYRLVIFTDTQRTFVVRNEGETDLTDIELAVVGTDSGHFEVSPSGLPAVIPAGLSASFQVTYVADDSDERAAELRIASNLAEPFVLNLAGGYAPLPPPPPIIIRHPEGSTVDSGQSATLAIQVVGDGLEYQWYVGQSGDTTSPIEGATEASYTTPALTADTSFWVRISDANELSTDSQTATVTVTVPTAPVIVEEPLSQSVTSGQTATLTVEATGAEPLEYQWYVGESGDTANPIEGATETSYTTPALTADASFWVRISDANELTADSQTATVIVTILTPPVIVEQPSSQSVNSGQTATLTVEATGAEPLEYQWYVGESGDTTSPIEGATEASYTTASLSASASFWVRISDANELSTDSQTATVTVTVPTAPVIVEQPSSQSVTSGQTATLTVEATGAEPLEYQWYAGESGDTTSPIEGATEASYTTPSLSASASFWVRVSDANELTTDSQTATVTVLTAPVIVEQPSSQSVTSGQTATLTVEATGAAPLEYQWFAGESGDTTNLIEGATEASYTTASLSASASFWVRVSDANELSTDSQTATVTVLTPEPAVLNAVEIRDGNLRLTITGPSGSRWRVWRSTDLLAWEPAEELEVIELVDGEAAIEIPLLEVPSAFHRLVQEP